MNVIERQLQLCINKINDWSIKNGFKFSRTKTVCMHFCLLRSQHPELHMEGESIKIVKELKFLGLMFDNKLNFIPHMRALRKKCSKTMDILKVLTKTKWGADSNVLLRLYRVLIRSRLDYGSIVYGLTRISYTKVLDTIHHQGIRLALGAFRTTPIQSLYIEAGESSSKTGV